MFFLYEQLFFTILSSHYNVRTDAVAISFDQYLTRFVSIANVQVVTEKFLANVML